MEQRWVRNTVLFLTSQAISIFGSFLVQYAIMWHITLTSQSGIMMTIYIICGLIPTFFVTPFAGVWADRFDRKKLIMLSDSFIAFVTLILAVLFYNGYNMLWLLFIAASLRSWAALQMPASCSPSDSAFGEADEGQWDQQQRPIADHVGIPDVERSAFDLCTN